MKKLGFIILLVLVSLSGFAQKSDKERALEALIESGMIRKDGKNLIVRVPSYADTARYKLMYSGLITDPNVRLRFETSSSVAVPTQPSNPISGTGLNTTGQTIVKPNELSQFEPGTGSVGMSKMKIFGFVGTINPSGSQQFSEHTWTVPEGVTSIRMEGWSAGADGFGASYGSGGGGGAGGYFMSVIDVTPGYVFRIRVPASGKDLYPLVIQSEAGSITLISGKFPQKMEGGIERFDARGGYLDQSTGNFSGNTLSIRGEDGEKSLAIPIERIGSTEVYKFYNNGSKGGNAPRGGAGGRGAIHISLREMDVTAKDGNYPGGGGGGGLEMTGIATLKSARGASGLLIIYY